jgi:hypothetical protein
MQTIEIYTPLRDDGGRQIGLLHETIFYDPEALVEPVRQYRRMQRVLDVNEGDPRVYVECLQTIYPIDGHMSPVTPGREITITAPDWYGRPWAQIWERYFEQGMNRPRPDIFSFE